MRTAAGSIQGGAAREPLRRGLALAGLALLLGACATRGAAPALPAGPAPSLVALETLRRTEEKTLYPERLDRRFLVGALDALEARFDSVRFDDRGESGVLEVGSARASVPLPGEFEIGSYLATLTRAVGFVDAHLEEEREPDDDLELIALRGGLLAIDRYATIFSGRGTEDFRIRFSGHLKGIGSTIGREDGNLVAIEVFPDSPAARGGLQDGDFILSIDGESTQPLTVSSAVDRIRGEEGTVVVLGVRRGERELAISITRGDVIVPSVRARALEGGVGYAWIREVSRTTGLEFAGKVGTLESVRGLVLDLRGNSGGAMSGAQQLADFFLGQRELIVRVVGRGGIEPSGPGSRLRADARVDFQLPVVVLVDPFTASAAEILSGALSPLDDVTLLGQQTFGKGVIQEVVPLPGENLLKLTVAQYLLSSDRVVEEVGIAPDIALAPISDKQLGALASLPAGAIPYLRRARKPGDPPVRDPVKADPFPVEAARTLLSSAPGRGLAKLRRRSARQVEQALAAYGVRWTDPGAALPEALPRPLQVVGHSEALVAGQPGSLRIEVTNPNAFPVPDVWLALDSAEPVFAEPDPLARPNAPRPAPPEYLANKLLALGEIPAGGTASGTLELTPPEGVAASDQPIGVSLASGMRPLQRERLVFPLVPQLPDVEFGVERSGSLLAIELRNRGAGGSGPVLVEVEGADRNLEGIAAGQSERIELPLSGDAKELVVNLSGPFARRRISLPVPEGALQVVPPRIEIAREASRAGVALRIEASDPAGLRDGWIVLDDQKQAYAEWAGAARGALRAELDAAHDHRLAVKVESSSGVTLVEARELWSTHPAPAY